VAVAAVAACRAAAVSAEARMTVGAMERVARGRETEGPATELMAREERVKRAARVRVRAWDSVRETAGRKRSEGVRRWRGGRAEIWAAVAEMRFCGWEN